MSATKAKPAKRKLSTFEFSEPCELAIARIQQKKGWTRTLCVETGVFLLENSLVDAAAAPLSRQSTKTKGSK